MIIQFIYQLCKNINDILNLINIKNNLKNNYYI